MRVTLLTCAWIPWPCALFVHQTAMVIDYMGHTYIGSIFICAPGSNGHRLYRPCLYGSQLYLRTRQQWSPSSIEKFRKTEALFRHSSYAAVALQVKPGMLVSCLAGVARMQPELSCSKAGHS